MKIGIEYGLYFVVFLSEGLYGFFMGSVRKCWKGGNLYEEYW